MRAVRIGWDGTEVGAPCFPPDWETEPGDLDLLRIATAFGACAAGEYTYQRPPADPEYSFFVEELPETGPFGFTDQQRTLLANMSWELTDPYFGEEVPGCDPKRPYGDGQRFVGNEWGGWEPA